MHDVIIFFFEGKLFESKNQEQNIFSKDSFAIKEQRMKATMLGFTIHVDKINSVPESDSF